MRVNQPDGAVRDEVVIVGGSGQVVGMNGDRLKVDANLNVDEVTVSNVGITSVDGAGMEQAGKYMPVKGEVKLTGSIVTLLKSVDTNFFTTVSPRLGYIHEGTNYPVMYGDVTPIDCSLYGELQLSITNGHDQAVSIVVYGQASQGNDLKYRHVIVATETIAAGARKVYSAKDYPLLIAPWIGLCVGITTTVQPTSGSISIAILGRV